MNGVGQIRAYSIASLLVNQPPTPGFDYHHLFAQCKDLLRLGKTDPRAAMREAEALMHQIKKQNVKLDMANYAALVQLFDECGQIEKGVHTLAIESTDVLRLVDEIEERGLRPHPRVIASMLSTLLLDDYHAGFARVTRMAVQMEMMNRSIEVVNVCITGAIQFQDPELGLYLYNKARESGKIQPNRETLRAMLVICQMLNIPDRALSIIDEFRNLWNVKADTRMFVQILQAVMSENWPEQFFQAEKAFRASGIEPNMEIWNLLVLGQGFYVGLDKAISVLEEMRSRGFQPDHNTLANLLSSCHERSDLDRALQLFRQWQQNKGEINSSHFGMLLNLALKTNNKEKMEDIVRMIQESQFADDDLLRGLIALNRDHLKTLSK